MEFWVEPTGEVSGIRVIGEAPEAMAALVVDTVARYKFAPFNTVGEVSRAIALRQTFSFDFGRR